ncbi:unnamed protein product [Discula destructiva]
MTSRGLSRLTATRWGSRPASSTPCFIPLTPKRHASTVQSNINLHRKSLHIHDQRIPRPTKLKNATIRPFTSSAPPQHPPTRRRRRLLLLLVSLVLGAHTLNQLRTIVTGKDNSPRHTLNKDLFTPCTVLANEALSPSAFLLTIQLPTTKRNDAILAAAWHHGLWSVEVKQPQLQIARNYTPLPPPVPASGGDRQGAAALAADGREEKGPQQLQFYVRRYDGGEVSTYLSRLGAGDEIEIRGPHLGFDLGERLGARGKRKLVFLAGGTGVAPALQAASFLLRRAGAAIDVDVLWANRGAADCAGCPRFSGATTTAEQQWRWLWPFSHNNSSGSEKNPATAEPAGEAPSAVTKQLRALQDAYAAQGRTLAVRCAVDAEGSFLRARDIADAVGAHGSSGQQSLAQASSSSSPACHFHSQRQLEYSTEESDAAGRDQAGNKQVASVGRPCICDGVGERGKNLFIISGPDGFVSAFAGPKIWADGGERQGPVGGVVAELMRQHPATWKDWLVLKQ